jgi:hypothetical protein
MKGRMLPPEGRRECRTKRKLLFKTSVLSCLRGTKLATKTKKTLPNCSPRFWAKSDQVKKVKPKTKVCSKSGGVKEGDVSALLAPG